MNTLLLLAATVALRNPFWPIGYEGIREIITDEPTTVVKAATATDTDETATSVTAEALAEAAETVTPRHWTAARQTLKIGGIVLAKQKDGSTRQSVMINGHAYANGDLISINHASRRFTWRVQGLTGGNTLRLERIRARRLTDLPKGVNP